MLAGHVLISRSNNVATSLWYCFKLIGVRWTSIHFVLGYDQKLSIAFRKTSDTFRLRSSWWRTLKDYIRYFREGIWYVQIMFDVFRSSPTYYEVYRNWLDPWINISVPAWYGWTRLNAKLVMMRWASTGFTISISTMTSEELLLLLISPWWKLHGSLGLESYNLLEMTPENIQNI